MLNVDNLVIAEDKPKTATAQFSFKTLAQQIIERQTMHKDTIIAVAGERRNGKSNWALKLIRQFIAEKKKENPDYKWSWKDNFPLTPAEAPKKAEKVADESFICMDEAGDIAYRGDANTIKTKNLIKFFNKCGKKKLLTIWILPDIYQLNPKILNMCVMLVIVPYRYKNICSSAFIMMRSPNALTQDKFGLERVKRILQSRKMTPLVHSATLDGIAKLQHNNEIVRIPYPKQLFKFYKSLAGFKYSHWFKPVSKQFENGYLKYVKSQQLMAHETEEKYVRRVHYQRVKDLYDTCLYNLHEKQGLSYQQITNLHLDENNQFLISKENIARRIGGMRARFEV